MSADDGERRMPQFAGRGVGARRVERQRPRRDRRGRGALARFSSHDWIGDVDVPTAVVVTERDRLVPPSASSGSPRRSRAPGCSRSTAITACASARPTCSSPRSSRRCPRSRRSRLGLAEDTRIGCCSKLDSSAASPTGRSPSPSGAGSAPQVVAGGRYRTGEGLAEATSVDVVDESSITKADAAAGGIRVGRRACCVRCRRARARACTGSVSVRSTRPIPATSSRATDDLSDDDVAEITRRLERLDRASTHGPWTSDVLACIAAEPGRRAPDFAGTIRTRGATVQARRAQAQGARADDQPARRLQAVAARRGVPCSAIDRDSATARKARRFFDGASGAQDRGAVAPSRLARRAFDRAGHADRRRRPRHFDRAPARSPTRRPPRAPPRSRSTPGSRAPRRSSTRPAEPASSGSAAPTATIVRSPCGDASDSTQTRWSPSRTYSCALSPVSSRSCASAGSAELRERALSSAARPSVARPNPSANRPSPSRRTRSCTWSATASRWAVARGSPVAATSSPRFFGPSVERVEDLDRLVEHADTAYTSFHITRLASHYLGVTMSPMPAPRTLSQKVWDRHVVRSAERRARPPLHRPPPRPRGHVAAGVRRPAHERPARSAGPTSRSPPRTTTSRPSTSTSRSPTRSAASRSRRCERTPPSSASRTSRWATPVRASCT